MSRHIYGSPRLVEGAAVEKKQPAFAPFFRALSDLTRLRLLNLLAGGEICVCYFVAVIGTNQPKISRHLAYLRKAGIVSSRRQGKWIYYRVAEPPQPGLARLLRETLAQLGENPQMRKDRDKLRNVQLASRRGPQQLAETSARLPTPTERVVRG